ncbi:MAG: hypothetical protein FJX63_10225 [Alphaproteobacteria bacterium]|nr:hypothetical protein [Alphaproteobacteria bacterium]
MPITAAALRRLSLAALLCCAPAALVRGEEGPEAGQELPAIESALQSLKLSQEQIAAEIDAALREQDRLARDLAALSRQIQGREAALGDSEAELLRLREERVRILAKLGEKQDVLAELLAGLQRLEANPPPALVVEPGDVLAALRGAMLFGAIVPELRAEAEELAADLERLDKVSTEIAASLAGIRDEVARLEAAKTKLEGLIARKQALIAKANGNLDGERRRTRELARKAKNIKQLMEELAAERARAEAERQRQAKAEEEAAIARRKAAEAPRIKFAEARGLLAFPAEGQVLRRYGDDDGLGGVLKGVVIATRDGAQVTAPVDGKVEFAGPFRSYGQVLILNPGGGYHILLAGLGRITAGTGEFLRAGEPVGEMGAGPSSVTLLGDAVGDKRPVLYIEFRNGYGAVDSAPWWAETRKEASG